MCVGSRESLSQSNSERRGVKLKFILFSLQTYSRLKLAGGALAAFLSFLSGFGFF